EVALPVHGDAPLGGLLPEQVDDLRRRQERRRRFQVEDVDLLVLLGEERAQLAQPRGAEGQDGALLLALDQFGLAVERVDVGRLDRVAGQDDADAERDPDRGDDDDDSREEQPPSQGREGTRRLGRSHGETALYPAPRTVRISSGRASLRRSWPTCT